jgi:hypothetical protein
MRSITAGETIVYATAAYIIAKVNIILKFNNRK